MVKFARLWGCLAVSRYANISALYSAFGQRFNNLTSARPIRTNRPRAQVVELVDALASGASGLTAVKVRVLSWAPTHPECRAFKDMRGRRLPLSCVRAGDGQRQGPREWMADLNAASNTPLNCIALTFGRCGGCG